MLLYLSSEKNSALFTAYLEEQGIFMDFTDIDDLPSVRTVWERRRVLPNYDYIFFYFDEGPLPEEELLSVVAYIRRFHHTRIILFAPKHAAPAAFFSELAGLGLRELVLTTDQTELTRELSECLSPDGKGISNESEILAQAYLEEAKKSARTLTAFPQDMRLTIGVAGTQSRIGVTTQVFFLYHALRALGCHPCIVDEEQRTIAPLRKYYTKEVRIDGSVITICDVAFAQDIQAGTVHDVFLRDCGILPPNRSLPSYDSCDVRFLCAGCKEWELPGLCALSRQQRLCCRIIFSFTSAKDRSVLSELLGEEQAVAFAPYTPDIWDDKAAQWHMELLWPLLQEAVKAC